MPELPAEAELLLIDRDPCPMGCGQDTDDPYGGPCTDCWNAIYDRKRRAEEDW